MVMIGRGCGGEDGHDWEGRMVMIGRGCGGEDGHDWEGVWTGGWS